MARAEQSSRWSLQGITSLVTGGTKGIGHAILEELTGLGATIHTCARDESQLNQYLKEWETKGFNVTGSVCDISSHTDREKLMQAVSSLFEGKLNILINNVGTCVTKPTTESTAEDFSYQISTNLESAYHLCQLSHPLDLEASSSFPLLLELSHVALDPSMVRPKELFASWRGTWRANGLETTLGLTLLLLESLQLLLLKLR